MKPEAVAALKDPSKDPTTRVVEAILRVGPRNAALISRLTGVPTETVRYKIKKQLREMGFRIDPHVDFQKLGLARHWGTIDFMPEYSELAVQILKALHEIGYLVYYARIIPQGYYLLLFALPKGPTERYQGFLKHLVDIGIVRTFSLEEVASSRYLSMNPKYFNFESGNWDIDWGKVESEKIGPDKLADEKAEAPLEPEFDKADLLLIKELQKDSIQAIIDIAKKIKIHPKTLRYHYHAHVENRKVIPRYLVRWMKDVGSSRAHSMIFTRLRFDHLTEQEAMRARRAVLSIPMTWSEEDLISGSHISFIFSPLELYGDLFSYLSRQIRGFGHKLTVELIDPFGASLFTIPYTLFDETKGWILSLEDLKIRFSQLVKTLS